MAWVYTQDLSDNAMKCLIGHYVLVDWPYMVEAKVIGVSTNSTKFISSESGIEIKPTTQEEVKQWNSEIADIKQKCVYVIYGVGV